ncbi:MAG: hypothetical protein ACP5RD_04410, partial [bacterium]
MKINFNNLKDFFYNLYNKLRDKNKKERNILIDEFYLNSSDLYSTFVFAKNKYNYSFYNSNIYKLINQNLEDVLKDNKSINNAVNIDNVLNPIYGLFPLSLLKNFNYLVSISSYIAFLISNEGSYNFNDVLNKVKNLMKQNNDNLLSEYDKSSYLPVFKEGNNFILSNIKAILSSLNPMNLDSSNFDKVFELYFKAKALSFILTNVNYLSKDLYLNLDSFINECFDLIKPLKDNFKSFYDNNKQILDINFYRIFIDLLGSYFSVSYKTNEKEAPKLMSLIYNLNLAKVLNPDLLDNSIINSNQENIIKNIINDLDFDKKELKKNVASNLVNIYIVSISSFLINSIKNGQNLNGESLDYLYLFFLTSIMLNYINNNQIDFKFSSMLSNLRNFFINKPVFSSLFD